MTPEEFANLAKNKMNNSIIPLIQQNTNLLCDVYQKGWADAMDTVYNIAKEKGITLW